MSAHAPGTPAPPGQGTAAPTADRRSPTVAAVAAALATHYTRGRRSERACYLVAAVLFASGLAHLGVQLVAGGPWSGPVSWRKPADFGTAFGLTLLAVIWASSFIRLSDRARGRLLGVFATACVVAVAVIAVQAWRGVPSHFNTTTALNAGFAYTAAGGGAAIIATCLLFTAAALRRNPDVSPRMRLAVACGFGSLLVALSIGAVMITTGTREVRTGGSQTAAYDAATVLVPGHATAMQGILLLPAITWLASFTPWSESRRARTAALACLGYLLCAGVVVVESFLGINPIDLSQAPAFATALAAAGAAGLLAAAIDTLAGVLRCSARGGTDRAPA